VNDTPDSGFARDHILQLCAGKELRGGTMEICALTIKHMD
jgi:hypothetical protein